MQVRAQSKNVKISPRKVRLVADAVKNHDIDKALAYLSLIEKRASGPIKKTIESAVANAVNNNNVSRGDLQIAEITVGEGIAYKRYHYAARGRIRPYKRRTSHVRVVLSTKDSAAVPVQADATVEEKPRPEADQPVAEKRRLLGRKPKKEENK